MAVEESEAIEIAAKAVDAEIGARTSAWRVRRLDREDAAYFIVLIAWRDGALSAVIVDAGSGEVSSKARIASGVSPIVITGQRAASLAELYPAEETELVWQPCDETRSPLYPLWRVRKGSEIRYVDQRGTVHKQAPLNTRRGG